MPARDPSPDQPDRWPRSRLGGLGLLLRHRGPVRGPALVVALLTLAVAALLAATPSVITAMTAHELDQTIENAPPTSRFLLSRPGGRWVTAPSADPSSSGLPVGVDAQYGTFQDQIRSVRARLPQPLRSLVGQPSFSIRTDPRSGDGSTLSTTPPGAILLFIPRMDPHLDRVAEIVRGAWPTPAAAGSNPVEVTVSEKTAAVLGWRIGEQVSLGAGGAGFERPRATLVGIFRPKNPAADYWALHPTVVQPNIFDDGNHTPKITSSMYVDPESFQGLASSNIAGEQVLVRYPLSLTGLSGSDAAAVLAQLRGATATTFEVRTDLPEQVEYGTIQSLRLTAEVIPALEAALDRVQTAESVLTVAAVGPLAAAIAVLVLAMRGLDRRRRPLIGLAATRGASPGRLRLLLAADGLLVGLPPAICSAGVMWWVFGRNASVTGLALALAVGLVPAAMLAAMPIEATMRPARADTGIRSTSRWRWVAELAVLGLAAVSLYLLTSAGLGASTGTDLLVAAAPLLLAGAACVVVLRLYPVPLHVLSRLFRRRPAAVGFLGATRALRDPVVGVAPVLAVLAGVSVAVFSTATLSTLTHGASQAALSSLGAPMRATGGPGTGITDAQRSQIEDLPGVAAVARTMLVGSMSVQISDRATRPTVDVYLADTAALARVQRSVPDAVPIPAGMTGGSNPGAVVSAGLATPGATVTMGEVRAHVVGSTDELTGLGRSPDFVLLDSSVTGFGPFRSNAVLISLTSSADVAAVSQRVTTLLGPTSTVRVAAADADALRGGAMATGMRVALIGALIAAGIAAAAALLLTMVLATTARARLLAILRILGLSTRQRRALVIWEQTPAAVVALLVGAGLGVGLAALVQATVDLAPFTGGRAQPALSVNAGLLAALLGGFVVLVAAATAVGLLATRRVTAATAIKLDEE